MLRLMKTRAMEALAFPSKSHGAPSPHSVPATPSRRSSLPLAAALVLTMMLSLATARSFAQGIKGDAPVTYDNRYEVYGGLNFMNFQAGQNLPTRMNLGGGEVAATYWLSGKSTWQKHLGLTLDYRGDLGTTPVNPNPYISGRPLVRLNIGMAGVQWRGPKNHYAAINYHAYGGVADGNFNHDTQVLPPGYTVGLYNNSTKPMYAVGGSLDYNRTKNIAFRFQPDLIFEHFGTNTREFVAISGGVIYRFGKNK